MKIRLIFDLTSHIPLHGAMPDGWLCTEETPDGRVDLVHKHGEVVEVEADEAGVPLSQNYRDAMTAIVTQDGKEIAPVARRL